MARNIPNKIELVAPQYSMSIAACNAIALNENGDTNQFAPFDIVHTLGSDKDVQAFSAIVGDDTGSASVLGQIATFNLVGDGTSTTGAYAEWRDSPFVVVGAGTTYKIVLNVVINSGAFVPTQFRYGELTVNVNDIGLIQGNQYTSSFTHTFEFTTGNQAALSQPIFYNSNQIAGSYTLEVQSIEQITNPNSFLTLQDKATEAHQTLGNSVDGGSSEELVTNGDFSDGFTSWSTSNGETVSDGVVITNGTSVAPMLQSLVLKAAKFYQFTIEIIEFTSGAGYQLYAGGSSSSAGIWNTVGVHTGTATSIHSNFEIETRGNVGKFTLVSVKEILPISTKYNQDKSFSNSFTTDVLPTDDDRVLLNINPNLAFELLKGSLTTGLSFIASNIKNMYLGNEGVNGGAYLQDLVVDLVDNTASGKGDYTTDIECLEGGGTWNVDGTVSFTVAPFQRFNGSCVVFAVNTTDLYKIVCRVKSSGNTSKVYMNLFTDNVQRITTTEFEEYIFIGYMTDILGYIQFDPQNGEEMVLDSLFIYELTAAEIQAYTANCRTFFKDTDEGVCNLKIIQDATGRGLDYVGDGIIRVDGDGVPLTTGFKPNLEKYSFREIVSGELQDFGAEMVSVDTDTWTLGTGITEDATHFIFTSVANAIVLVNNTLSFLDNTKYLLEFKVEDYVEGGVFVRQPIPDTYIFGEDGVFSRVIDVVTVGIDDLHLRADGTTTLKIRKDSITLKKLTTKTQRTDDRIITVDNSLVTPEHKLYIGKVLQPYAPVLPNPATIIEAWNTAQIGYNDDITQRHATLDVWAYALTQSEIDAL